MNLGGFEPETQRENGTTKCGHVRFDPCTINKKSFAFLLSLHTRHAHLSSQFWRVMLIFCCFCSFARFLAPHHTARFHHFSHHASQHFLGSRIYGAFIWFDCMSVLLGKMHVLEGTFRTMEISNLEPYAHENRPRYLRNGWHTSLSPHSKM